MLLGIRSLAAALQLEIYWVYMSFYNHNKKRLTRPTTNHKEKIIKILISKQK
ncbi:Hypothetical protein PAU_00935 [Photorhabdus asymbiotica]|uniref:Uncharacterized protein n=1 Tax=Photorhabdus asymbiotica subsp. asymbiotica (strain ATCC 43949 / 3105-77) TaxID=553480 RepID=B6VMS2_PHOAA|nr:Hypothetical protein PAU_00935 [Photorhabdus asymbiotica]CAR67452.1 Hypothetical protein PA-RVA14-1076 [Photorhabdus asymbiotica subsp. asymbiotica ATCC 43949]